MIQNDSLVTVIVPIWNAEKTIQNCLHSILQQTYSNLEIIVVNDGSTDATREIVTSLAIEDPRILIVNQKNQGVSVARNTGLNLARGQFLAFVDADDWVELNFIEKHISKIQYTNSECSICDVFVHDRDKSISIRLDLTESVFNLDENRHLFLTNLLRFHFDYANWNKVYNAEIIRLNNIRFNEKMTSWEDLLFNIHYFMCCKKVSIVQEPLYHYIISLDGLTHQGMHAEVLIANLNQLYNQCNMLFSPHNRNKEIGVLQIEINRITYFQLLDHLYRYAEMFSKSLWQRWRIFRSYLGLIDRRIFKVMNIKLNSVAVKNQLLYLGVFDLIILHFEIKRFLKTK